MNPVATSRIVPKPNISGMTEDLLGAMPHNEQADSKNSPARCPDQISHVETITDALT